MKKLDRRKFLISSGGIYLALPLMPSLFSQAYGQANSPKRFIYLFKPNGFRTEDWWPNIVQNSIRQLSDNVKEAPLSSVNGDLSSTLSGAWDPLRDKLLMLRGMHSFSKGEKQKAHIAQNILAGCHRLAPAYPSIDQIIAHKNGFYLAAPVQRYLALHLRQTTESGHIPDRTLSWQKNGGRINQVQQDYSARIVFDKLFRNIPTQSENQNTEQPEVDLKAARQKTIVDNVLESYKSFRNNPKLAKEDRERLDSHVQFIHELEQRIAASDPSNGGPTGMCNPPSQPRDLPVDQVNHYIEIMKAQFDNIVAAVKCDLTRVATFQLGPCIDYKIMNSLVPGLQMNNTHHNLTHQNYDQNVSNDLQRINRWYFDQIADFLKKLDVEESNGKTYLDNSIVVMGSEIDVTSQQSNHNSVNLPVLMAGSAGGYFKTGRYLDFRNGSGQGRYYNELLITLMYSMGLNPADWEQGSQGFGQEPAGGHGSANKRSPLPHIG